MISRSHVPAAKSLQNPGKRNSFLRSALVLPPPSIFQEAWEKEQGEYWEDMGPPIVKTQADILERK